MRETKKIKWHNFICSECSDQNNKNAKSGTRRWESGGRGVHNCKHTPLP